MSGIIEQSNDKNSAERRITASLYNHKNYDYTMKIIGFHSPIYVDICSKIFVCTGGRIYLLTHLSVGPRVCIQQKKTFGLFHY